MNRRGFLNSILAAAVAPAIVRADSLMRIVPRSVGMLTQAEICAAFNVPLSLVVADILQWSGMSPAEYDLSALNQPVNGIIMDDDRTIGERLKEVCRVSNTELWMKNDVLRFKPRSS